MTDAVLGLLLVAGLCHAIWNALARTVREREAFFALMQAAAIVLYAPLMLRLLLQNGYPVRVLPLAAASALFEIAYFICLARAYRAGSFLCVYPVARGSAPVITTVISLLFLGLRPSATGLAGIALVAAGILSIGRTSLRLSGLRRQWLQPGTGWALLTGTCTAGYTVCDGIAAHLMVPVLYAYSLFFAILPGMAYLDRGRVTRTAIVEVLRREHWKMLAAGFLMFGVSAITLTAMSRAPVAYVAATREISIVFATAIGALFLKERPTKITFAAILAVAVGVACIRLS